MNRCLVLFLLFAGAALAGITEDGVILRKTMMRTDNSIVTITPGTKVLIMERGEKTITVKVNGKVGTVPWDAFDAPSASHISWGSQTSSPAPAPAHAQAAPAAVATTVPPTSAPPPPRKAQTMYGKMVEKARDTADAHEKTLVHPTDEVLDGK